MTPNFRLYSQYYDLLYQDKDYKSEAAYITRHLKQLLPDAKDLLELGCGTGNHARYLSEDGYNITGIERSPEMITLAKQKTIRGFEPIMADITDFRLGRKFDAALSLFHSLCYITTNEEIVAAFKAVSNHLNPGGIFAFDLWYGPAVLHHLPVSRSKVQQNEYLEVVRHGETTMHLDRNVAEVSYEIIVKDRANDKYVTLKEVHPMRYFSIPEIGLIAEQTGFKMKSSEEFLTASLPTLESWNIFIILEKKDHA
ncbi:MAG: class I SAM-dependent methyltransferase [Chitinophagaceae bacterium]